MNGNRVIRINFSEFSLDPGACAEMINSVCVRHPERRVTGVLAGEDFLLVTLEEALPHGLSLKYNFAPLEGTGADELGAEITARYFAGFTLIGGFRLRDVYWALFGSEPK